MTAAGTNRPDNTPADFYRIRRLPPYVFERVGKLKAAARARGEDVIDLGMGNPDMPPPAHVIAKLAEAAGRPGTSRYSTSRGIPGLRRAQAAYYARRFGVDLDPDSEIVVTLGSKEGFANMAQALAAPGDVFLAPDPSYPIHAFGFVMSGAAIRHVRVPPGDDFAEEYLRGLDAAARRLAPAPVGVVVNFPSNPSCQVAGLDFYRELLKIAERFDLIVLSDLAYAELYFAEEDKPPSMLQVPGARERVIEFTSMSKTYAMPGWRIGFAVGSARLAAALARVKSYLDYGAFTPVQVAATAALNGPQDFVDEMRSLYRSRRDALISSMARAGWDIPSPRATMFVWAPLPPALADMGSLAFSEALLQEGSVAVSPGVGFGSLGEGYVRFALVENEQRIRQAARGVRKMLASRGAATG